MKYEDIKDFSQRCEEHPGHQTGMVSYQMIQQRLSEEIDELREYIEQRTWVGLTDEEVYEIYTSVEEEVNEHWEKGGTTMMFPPTLYKAFETKLKEKNT